MKSSKSKQDANPVLVTGASLVYANIFVFIAGENNQCLKK